MLGYLKKTCFGIFNTKYSILMWKLVSGERNYCNKKYKV